MLAASAWLFDAGVLIGDGASRIGLAIGYVVGGGTMIVGGLVEIVFGIDAQASRSSRSRPRSFAVES